jgi:RNA polymerase sigma-70 factor (ECF subfamily)
VSTWLFGIANNLSKNKLLYQQRFDKLDEEPSIELGALHQEKSDLDETISLLNEKHKNVILLKYKEGFIIEVITSILSISKGTVKSRFFTAHKKLNQLMKRYTTLFRDLTLLN